MVAAKVGVPIAVKIAGHRGGSLIAELGLIETRRALEYIPVSAWWVIATEVGDVVPVEVVYGGRKCVRADGQG